MRRTVISLAAVLLVAAALTVPAVDAEPTSGAPTKNVREVMFAGNNWDGTATVIDAHTHRTLHREHQP